jgi:hypothetical protein
MLHGQHYQCPALTLASDTFVGARRLECKSVIEAHIVLAATRANTQLDIESELLFATKGSRTMRQVKIGIAETRPSAMYLRHFSCSQELELP